jgi:hypothetical protein
VTYVPSDKQNSDEEFRLTSTFLCTGMIFLTVAMGSVVSFVGTTLQVKRMTDDYHGRALACYA